MDDKEKKIERLKGCPICEHSDPALEKDLDELAQMLFESWREKQQKEAKEKDSSEAN